MSLSKEPVFSELKNHFVCGYRDIMGEKYAGNSGTHKPSGNAVDTTNGAGSHNIQMFIMNPDGTVVHCLPGYWNPQDMTSELQLAMKLNDVYKNHELSPELKAKRFAQLQTEHIRFHSAEEQERSKLQGFDAKHEAEKPNSDFVKDRSMLAGEWHAGCMDALKTTDVVMHERMAKRPFMTYSDFDTAQFADYGTQVYDKHEDTAFDEYGQHVAAEGPMKFEPIKNAKSMAAAKNQACTTGMCPASAAPKTHKVAIVQPVRARGSYVKTYGVVRVPPQQQ